MKILRVINSMNPASGGPCQGIRNTVPQMTSLGAHTEVLCLDDPKSDWMGKDVFTVHAVGKAQGPWAYHAELLPWLKNHMSSFDVVIVHGLWQYHSYAVIKVQQSLKKQRLKCPSIYVMPHGMLDPYFQKAEGRKLKAIRNSLYWHLIEAKVVRNADGLLFTCQEELELAAKTFNRYQPKAVYNVGYGVLPPPELNQIHTKAFKQLCPETEGKPYILFLSRVHEKKGVDILLSAYDKVYANDSTAPMLIIAGPGMETDYGKRLKKIVDNSSFLNSNVRFVGMLQGDIKWGAFYNAETFILPSHQENFGIAVAEALACKLPVLISNKVNIWREIESKSGGFVANDDEDGIIGLLNKWKNCEVKVKQDMRLNAYAAYDQFFTVQQAANNVMKVLKTKENA